MSRPLGGDRGYRHGCKEHRVDITAKDKTKTAISRAGAVGSGGRVVERRTVNRGDDGSIPPTAVSKLMIFRSSHISLCLSEETLKAGGPFCLVSMPEEVKYSTQGVNV